MGVVIPLHAPAPARDPEEVRAWDEMVRLRDVAEAHPSIRNMIATTRAWERWLALAIPNEAERRSLLS